MDNMSILSSSCQRFHLAESPSDLQSAHILYSLFLLAMQWDFSYRTFETCASNIVPESGQDNVANRKYSKERGLMKGEACYTAFRAVVVVEGAAVATLEDRPWSTYEPFNCANPNRYSTRPQTSRGCIRHIVFWIQSIIQAWHNLCRFCTERIFRIWRYALDAPIRQSSALHQRHDDSHYQRWKWKVLHSNSI